MTNTLKSMSCFILTMALTMALAMVMAPTLFAAGGHPAVGGHPAAAATSGIDWSDVARRIGPGDSVLVAAPDGAILFSKNADALRAPASTLKVLTALVALSRLGIDFRFETEFYLSPAGDLKIKGHGDPLLISEVIAQMAAGLSEKISTYADLALDNTHFAPIRIPGVTTTDNPYDAPNGALCANFNTVFFKRGHSGLETAEPQTPLLPFAIERIRARGARNGRIILSQERDDTTLYAGELFRYFLRKAGVAGGKTIRLGKVEPTDRLILRQASPFALTDVIARLMAHSNNYIANQLLTTAGVAAYGPPGTLEKGVAAARNYAEAIPELKGIRIAEGSGISRENRISAVMMHRLLREFAPYRHLMTQEGPARFKTGTLSGVSARAGYITAADGGDYPFVVFMNTPGRSAEAVMGRIVRALR